MTKEGHTALASRLHTLININPFLSHPFYFPHRSISPLAPTLALFPTPALPLTLRPPVIAPSRPNQ